MNFIGYLIWFWDFYEGCIWPGMIHFWYVIHIALIITYSYEHALTRGSDKNLRDQNFSLPAISIHFSSTLSTFSSYTYMYAVLLVDWVMRGPRCVHRFILISSNVYRPEREKHTINTSRKKPTFFFWNRLSNGFFNCNFKGSSVSAEWFWYSFLMLQAVFLRLITLFSLMFFCCSLRCHFPWSEWVFFL